jgi:hypothetical protein
MILHPAVLALLVASALISLMLVLSSWHGVRILRSWDLKSGSGLQLELERRTYLISTILAYVLGFQLASLFLFIYMGDALAGMFTGAMCAAGTLNVNAYGYPVLLLKVLNFLLAGLWLVLNHADNQAEDYPLIRKKYGLLLVLAPLILLEAVLQARYFAGLNPEVITSCCGSLFGTSSAGPAAFLASLPVLPSEITLAVLLVLTLASEGMFVVRGRGGIGVAVLSAAVLITGIASLISFIGPYVYELPMHRCPFCVLQKEYGYIGYVFYSTLLGGALFGMAVGLLHPFRKVTSLHLKIPGLQRTMAMLSASFFALFGIVTIGAVLFSNLRW